MERTFMGYQRADGSVGTRNYLVILPSVFCANSTVQKIAAQIPGAVPMTHCVGCSQVGLDLELTARTLKAMGCHPNAGAVIVVGLGCERFDPEELYQAVKATGKPVAKFVIQEEGGPTKTVEKAVAVGKKFAAILAQQQRVPCPLSALMVGTKCGGTDATSGLASNPAVGNMVDRLVDAGGSAILSELNELLGTEKFLAKRAVNAQVAQKIYDAVYEIEDVLRGGLDFSLPENRNHLISRGNFAGGVSSVVEKALGGVHKGGTRPIQDVLPYAIPPQKGQHGLFLMDYESQDGEEGGLLHVCDFHTVPDGLRKPGWGSGHWGNRLRQPADCLHHRTGSRHRPPIGASAESDRQLQDLCCYDGMFRFRCFSHHQPGSQHRRRRGKAAGSGDPGGQRRTDRSRKAGRHGAVLCGSAPWLHGYHKKDPAELRKHEKEVGNC